MDTNTLLKELRDITGAGIMDIKSAMEEAGGDKDKAIDILRKKGQAKVAKKADRVASEGIIESYIHAGGRVGVLVEVNTETDFVSRTDDFKLLAKEVALHIAASNPLYINIADVPAEVVEKEKEIYKEQVTGKPESVAAQILEGKIAKYYEEVCLMEQPFVKNPDIRIKELVAENVSKLGENIVIRRFARFNLGN
jgi:elongation factor Ts